MSASSSNPHLDLQEILQNEFCPPLDTSLVAAFVGDRDNATQADLHELRVTLAELAAQAEQDSFADFSIDGPHEQLYTTPNGTTDSSSTADSSSMHDLSSNTIATSLTSDVSSQSFSSPLGFLQTAFPSLPREKLVAALYSFGDPDDADMLTVMEDLLSQEYLRELEERGLDGLDDGQDDGQQGDVWELVQSKTNKSSSTTPKVKKHRGRTVTLVDIRQKQHVRPARPLDSARPAPDPWVQVASLATHLATILGPPHTESFFLSAFHAPGHATPAAAVRKALGSIAREPEEHEICSDETVVLFNLFDVLQSSPDFQVLDSEERVRLMDDAQLALRATKGRPDEALEIVWLLRELDADADLAMGIYHSPAPSSTASPVLQSRPSPASVKTPAVLRVTRLPSGPPELPVKPSPVARRATTDGWQTVSPQKKRPNITLDALAQAIPAYNPVNETRRAKIKARGTGNRLGKGGKGDVGELLPRGGARARLRELQVQRNDALREASKAWSRGNTKTRGGEVALYYAERARQLHEQSRNQALEMARGMVESKRIATGLSNQVDLHGTTVAEALTIVREILVSQECTAARPLTIITGKGTHSANHVGVLGPAIKNALTQEGWHVTRWDGGLMVRGSGR